MALWCLHGCSTCLRKKIHARSLVFFHSIHLCFFFLNFCYSFMPGVALNQEATAGKIRLPRRNLLVEFTCNSCGERTQRIINRVAYDRGTVFLQVTPIFGLNHLFLFFPLLHYNPDGVLREGSLPTLPLRFFLFISDIPANYLTKKSDIELDKFWLIDWP